MSAGSHEAWLLDMGGHDARDCPACHGNGVLQDSGANPLPGAPNYRNADLWEPYE